MKKWMIVLLSVVTILVLLCGGFLYITKYKITGIDEKTSPDGAYTLFFQEVGEPDWPFGASHARLVLKKGDRTVSKIPFDIANDGKRLFPENWKVTWRDDAVEALVLGEEQKDVCYTVSFDGMVKAETLKEEKPDFSEEEPTENVFSETAEIDLSSLASVNEKDENVFSVSMEDFIAAYNGSYGRSHGKAYLTATTSEGWYRDSRFSPRFGYEATRSNFSEDRAILPMPTMTFYSSEREEIYEVRVTFDDHGYRESMAKKYKEIVSCLLQMACPTLTEDRIGDVFDDLYSLAYENFFGDHHLYGDPERPPLSRLLQSGNIGFYGFYGSGNIEICMIPLTPNALELLEAEGTLVEKIPDE